jgi:ribosomal protein S21
MVEVRKKDNENSISFIRRFTKRVQMSGVLLDARKRRYRQKQKNKRLIRLGALRREKINKERELLEKLGKTEELYTKYGKPRR